MIFLFLLSLFSNISTMGICYKEEKKNNKNFYKRKKHKKVSRTFLPSFLPRLLIMTWVFGLQLDTLLLHGQECLGNVSVARAMARGSSVVNQTQAAQSDIHSQASPQGCQGFSPLCPPHPWLMPRSGCVS